MASLQPSTTQSRKTHRWLTLNLHEVKEDLRRLQSEWESGELSVPVDIDVVNDEDWGFSSRWLGTKDSDSSGTWRYGSLGPPSSSKRDFNRHVDMGSGSQNAVALIRGIIPMVRLSQRTGAVLDASLARQPRAAISVQCTARSAETVSAMAPRPPGSAAPLICVVAGDTLSLQTTEKPAGSGKFKHRLPLARASSVRLKVGQETLEADDLCPEIIFCVGFQTRASEQHPALVVVAESKSEED